jgi:hypothetical protein
MVFHQENIIRKICQKLVINEEELENEKENKTDKEVGGSLEQTNDISLFSPNKVAAIDEK